MKKIISLSQFLNVVITLLYIDIVLRRKGFHFLFKQYTAAYRGSEIKKSNDDSMTGLIRYLDLIDRACSWYPLEAQCLHRSFLGYKYIRTRLGIPVEIVIGVKKFPFYAHAWLILNGRNINEKEIVTRNLKVILSSKDVKNS